MSAEALKPTANGRFVPLLGGFDLRDVNPEDLARVKAETGRDIGARFAQLQISALVLEAQAQARAQGAPTSPSLETSPTA